LLRGLRALGQDDGARSLASFTALLPCGDLATPIAYRLSPIAHRRPWSPAPQNMNFAANWTWRAEPESPVAKRVLVITPKAVLPTVAMRPG